MHQRVLISGFILHEGKVLLLKRGEKGFLANHWELPGGKLEHGEDPICGVLREVQEEAGILCDVIRPYHAWHAVNDYKGEPTHFVEIDFLLALKPGQRVTPADGMTAYAWVGKEELDQHLMTPQMRKAIQEGFAASKNN